LVQPPADDGLASQRGSGHGVFNSALDLGAEAPEWVLA
jgi:hypothetical protein